MGEAPWAFVEERKTEGQTQEAGWAKLQPAKAPPAGGEQGQCRDSCLGRPGPGRQRLMPAGLLAALQTDPPARAGAESLLPALNNIKRVK